MTKSKNPNQVPLNFEEDGRPPGPPLEYWTERDLLLEQVRRDYWFLRSEGPFLPSKEFYEERLAKFRQAILDLDKKMGR
jgi:hypothetical protein